MDPDDIPDLDKSQVDLGKEFGIEEDDGIPKQPVVKKTRGVAPNRPVFINQDRVPTNRFFEIQQKKFTDPEVKDAGDFDTIIKNMKQSIEVYGTLRNTKNWDIVSGYLENAISQSMNRTTLSTDLENFFFKFSKLKEATNKKGTENDLENLKTLLTDIVFFNRFKDEPTEENAGKLITEVVAPFEGYLFQGIGDVIFNVAGAPVLENTQFPSKDALDSELKKRYSDMINDENQRKDWFDQVRLKFNHIQSKRKMETETRIKAFDLKQQQQKQKQKQKQKKEPTRKQPPRDAKNPNEDYTKEKTM